MGDTNNGTGGCAGLRALISEYAALTCRYSSAVTVFSNRRNGTKADYQILLDEVEMTRIACENARKAVQEHRKEHGC
jgi:hypothetical protein